MRTKSILVAVLAIALPALAPVEAWAQVPQSMPVQGFLTDVAGVPVDGTVTVQFSIYDAAVGSAPLWSESQSVMVADGVFTAYLGAATQLDLSVFDGGPRWVALRVNVDAEMSPRLQIGTVPYAARAAVAAEWDSVPPGSVMFFDRQTCPEGWSLFAALQGRVPVGLASDGTPGAAVGAALAAGGTRTINQVPQHTHSIDPPTRTTTGDGGHSHSVDPPSANTSTTGSHAHSGTTSTDGSHKHTLWLAHAAPFAPGDGTNYVQGAGANGDGLVTDHAAEGNAGSHSHSFNTSSSGSHGHAVNIEEFDTARVADHTHSVDIPAFSSAATGVTAVDVTMPYVQLVACRKD